MILNFHNNEGGSWLYLKTVKKRFLPFYIYLLSVLALLLFLFGFFPFKYSSKVKEGRIENENIFRKRHIDKLAFIVIDALRFDFVFPSIEEKYMPFLSSSIFNKSSCYMTVKAHPPTVTLPRIKAITSGSLSTFVDVVMNFMTPAFEEDNFINIAASNGLKLVFYGDNIWLKLFPSSFVRSEGTHSFFTFDYSEVDNNVTRHIDNEFKNYDWDIIILHYLGLDHIGHTEGRNSPLIKLKLLEMDYIVKKINDYLKSLEKNQGLKTMLIVTGDHGMKDSGSHGGATFPEVTVPLVSVGNPCLALPGWPESHTPLQIDLAPTLSVIFGLPIPANNMGKIIPDLFHNMHKEDVLKNLEINRLGLDKFRTSSYKGIERNSLKNDLENWLLNEKKEEVGKNLTKKYFIYLDNISQEIIKLNSDFNLFYLIVGIILLWIFLIYLVFDALNQYAKPKNLIHWFFIIGTFLHAISLLSTSFIEEEHQTWYFLWTTFCFILIFKLDFGCVNLSSINKAKCLFSWIILAFMHRILRKLNQTGDKWAFLPDIKSYLYTESGQPWLFYMFLLGVGMVFSCALLEKCPILNLITYGISLFAIICYRIASKTFKVQYIALYPSSSGFTEVLVFWTALITFTLQSVHKQTPLYLIWLIFISFYLRPHNVILLPIQVLISKKLNKQFYQSDDLVWNNAAHIWMGNVFYFYQGNGNSLSNVDVAAGFMGVQAYYPVYSGVVIVAHTFSSHILSFILSPKLDLSCALSRLIPVTLYCTTLLFQLDHLFIWTVFSPKLLFEASITLLVLFLLVFNYLFKSIFKL